MENINPIINQPINLEENKQALPSQSKINPLIIISLIFLIILIAAGSFVLGKYWSSLQEKPEITQTIKPNKTVSPSPSTNPTTGEKTYIDTNYNFTFRYPSEWISKENKQNIFQISENEKDSSPLFWVEIFDGNIGIIGETNISKVQDYIENYTIFFSGNSDLDIKKIEEKDLFIGKNKMRKTIFKITNPPSWEQNTQWARVYISVIKDNNEQVIMLGYNGREIQTFDQILSTLRFLDDTQSTNAENWKKLKIVSKTGYSYELSIPVSWTIGEYITEAPFPEPFDLAKNLYGNKCRNSKQDRIGIIPATSNLANDLALIEKDYLIDGYTRKDMLINNHKIIRYEKIKEIYNGEKHNSYIVFFTSAFGYVQIIGEEYCSVEFPKIYNQILSTFNFID